MVPSNQENLLGGLGLDGEEFNYPGHAQAGKGFSRFSYGTGRGRMLHALHMSHGVTLDQCDEIVERHQLLAPHGVWLVDAAHGDASVATASAERLGDCGLFLATRSAVDAQIWSAFYEYARFVLRLGHVDTWLDTDILAAVVHSSEEGPCNPSTSKVCLWWSEFDLDDEEYSCRPRRDASNIVTPSILLTTLASNDVAYPPPSPPPPKPPFAPPPPVPPPGAIRCELSGIASTDGLRVPAYDAVLDRYVPVQKKCWRWDPANDWPPFAVHRDIYEPADRCSGQNSRDVRWNGGFKQSLVAKGANDVFEQANDDCPWIDVMAYADYTLGPGETTKAKELMASLKYTAADSEDGVNCKDRTNMQQTDDNVICDLGTNAKTCGASPMVVFGFAGSWFDFGYKPNQDVPFFGSSYKANVSSHDYCVSRRTGKVLYMPATCEDGGPGAGATNCKGCQSLDATEYDEPFDLCFYGTHGKCPKRRFAFPLDQAGPDEPDDSCEGLDFAGNSRIGNGRCEDGLMWSDYPPGKAPCQPNTDVTDCGWRMPKRTARVEVAEENTCGATECFTHDCLHECLDFSDDSFATVDFGLSWAVNGRHADIETRACGRGTSDRRCAFAAETAYKSAVAAFTVRTSLVQSTVDTIIGSGNGNGTMEYNKNKYHKKIIYVQAASSAHSVCTPPPNIVTGTLVSAGTPAGTLVYPVFGYPRTEVQNGGVSDDRTFVREWKVWFDAYSSDDESKDRWVEHVCSDGGEGSFRVPLHVPYTYLPDKKHPFVHMDFACPYGSQPGVCPDRDMSQFRRTQDELVQPSGPEFSNCFDENVPDFECCHAVNEFRIHGGPGVVGQTNPEELGFCARPSTLVHYYTSTEYASPQVDGVYLFPRNAMHPLPGSPGNPGNSSRSQCRDRCSETEGCVEVMWTDACGPEGKEGCTSLSSTALVQGSCAGEDERVRYAPHCYLFDADGTDPVGATLGIEFRCGDDYINTWTRYTKVFVNADRNQGECPTFYTSYHHTSTGCKAFCEMAFQREGNDNTCTPAVPECANPRDADTFPQEYVTVDAECICGAKLEQLQASGKYVNTGRASESGQRALHEDEGEAGNGGHWEWPDAVRSGVDQFHGETPIASLEHRFAVCNPNPPPLSLLAQSRCVQARTLTRATRASPRS